MTSVALEDQCGRIDDAMPRRRARGGRVKAKPKTKGKAKRRVSSVSDFLLPGGKRLGDATPEEIHAAAAYYKEEARRVIEVANRMRRAPS